MWWRLQTVPIIAMTADAFEEEKKKTLEAGMNYHLSKPINLGLTREDPKESENRQYITRMIFKSRKIVFRQIFLDLTILRS